MQDELARIAATPACAMRPSAGFVPKYPQPSAADRRREAALREALLSGAVPLRDPRKMAMLKPKPMLYDPDLSHLANCTVCINQDAARAAVRQHSLPTTPHAVHVLVDDAPLALWSDNMVHELERPKKARVEFELAAAQPPAHQRAAAASPRRKPPALRRAHDVPRSGFGMPGTVLHEGGRFRAWLGQSRQRYAESADGLVFDAPGSLERGLRWMPQYPWLQRQMAPSKRSGPRSAPSRSRGP